MEQSPKVKRALEIINRMSELSEEHEKMMLENGHPKGQMPAYVEFTKEQWDAYAHNRKEQKQLLAELLSITPR